MAFGKKKTLRVEFVESRTQALIGFDELPLKEIPESFKDATWVEIDYDRWKVVRVDPDKMRQARREGLLRVHVDLVERRPRPVEESAQPETPIAPVEEVKEAPIYRNPSRADQMPRLSGKRDDLNLLEIATYEWRDIEFTVETNRSTVRDVFAKIAELVHLNSTERDGRTFYTRQYDRYDMFAPMRGPRLALETVITDYFPAAMAVDGLTFMGSDKVADSTFVFRVGSGIGFYGQEFDDVIRYFGVVRPGQLMRDALRADAAQMASLMKKKELILVDWQRREVVEADEDAVYDFFLRGFAAQAVAVAHGQTSHSTVPPISLEKPVAPPPNVEVPAAVASFEPVAVEPLPAAPPAVTHSPALPETPEVIAALEPLPAAPPAVTHSPALPETPEVVAAVEPLPVAPPAVTHSPALPETPEVIAALEPLPVAPAVVTPPPASQEMPETLASIEPLAVAPPVVTAAPASPETPEILAVVEPLPAVQSAPVGPKVEEAPISEASPVIEFELLQAEAEAPMFELGVVPDSIDTPSNVDAPDSPGKTE